MAILYAMFLFVVLVAIGDCSLAQSQKAHVVIDAYPNTAEVEQGTTLVLVCRVVGVPSTTALSYQWTCPGGSCDAGAVDPEWAAKVQQGNILVVNVRNGNDAGNYTCTVIEFKGDGTTQQVGVDVFTLSVAIGLSFVNVDGGLGVFFPINSFVTNSTLTKTTKSGRPAGGNDHIACYGGDPQAAQVTWHDSGGGPLAVCLSNSQPAPCPACGSICGRNGAVGLDPPQQGHTDIHLFTGDPRYVNQDLQCRVSVSGGQSAFIGVYLSNRGALQPPSPITQGATTTTTVSVSWSRVSSATGYYVSYQRQDLGAPPVVTPQYERIVGGASTIVTLSGLEPGTTYRIRVWSTNGTSVSSEAREMNVTTVESASTPPRMLTTAGSTTSSSVELNWLPPLHPNGAIHYEIEYEPAMPPGDPVNAGNSSSPYFTLTLPNEFLSYTVRVVAVNSQGRANSSDLLCLGKNRERGPQAPTGVSVDTLGDESVVVSWDAQLSMQCDVVIGNYSVRYQLRNGCTAGYTTVYTSETNVTLQELEPGATYRVSVASIASNGEMSAYSNWVNFTNVMATPSQVACPCSCVGASVGAAGGGFIGGLLTAIAGCLACAVFYRIRTNRETTAKRATTDDLYENPQLQRNPAYGTSSVHKEGRQEATYYETCMQ